MEQVNRKRIQEINKDIERAKTLDRKKLLEEKAKNKAIEYHLYWHTTVHYLMLREQYLITGICFI